MRKEVQRGEGRGFQVRAALIFLLLLTWVLGSGVPRTVGAQEDRTRDVLKGEKPKVNGETEASSSLLYKAGEDLYLFDASLHATLRMLFERERAEAVLTVEYLDELGLGESYLRGGTEYSNVTIGSFVEDWGAGFSSGLPSVLNARDDRYPDNIFYSRYYKPNPLLSMTVGKDRFFAQAALSNREAAIRSVDDSDFGTRGAFMSETVRVSGGMIKRIGASPLLSFMTLEQKTEGGRVWLEVDWEYSRSAEDIWNLALGLSRELSFAKINAEYLILDTEDILFLEEDLAMSSLSRFDLKLYVHFPDFSTAVSGFFVIGIDKGFTFEPGFYGFIGRRGHFFSPVESENYTENDNRVEMRLRFVF